MVASKSGAVPGGELSGRELGSSVMSPHDAHVIPAPVKTPPHNEQCVEEDGVTDTVL